MADVVDKATRSRMMSNIKGQNTKPEIYIRSGLHKLGFRFQINDNKLKGKPDVVLKRLSAVIFINGCFWHGHDCHYFKLPKTRPDFWFAKIESNKKRDAETVNVLHSEGWRVCIVWECAIKTENKGKLFLQLEKWLNGTRKFKEIG
jgi:DNA mismatch endonuclease (patch repair protein)